MAVWPEFVRFDQLLCRLKNRAFIKNYQLVIGIFVTVSNTKNVICGTHRGVSAKHLQAYLSEIAYRFNRRFWEKELLDRLIQACISGETVTYDKLVHPNRRPSKV